MRFFFYSHDGFGLGHTRRHLAIASALTDLEPQASVLLASGAEDVYRFEVPPRVEVLKVPGLRKVSNGEYQPRRLGLPIAEVHLIRSSLLEAAVRSFDPAVVVVDKHPFGVNGEMRTALARCRQSDARTVLGLRDILDERTRVVREWAEDHTAERVAESFDRLLVYGERLIFDPIAEYELSSALNERTHFCGYVVNQEESHASRNLSGIAPVLRDHTRPLVLATAGGGEDGFSVLRAFIESATDACWQGLVVTGPMMPDPEFEALQRLAARSGVLLQAFVPTLATVLRSVDALVCMGGYNTLAEALSLGVPTVCVPRIVPRSEQLLRALAFERLGLLRVVHPAQVNLATLRQAIQTVLTTPREELLQRANSLMHFDGARQAAQQLLALASGSRHMPEAETIVSA